MSWQTDLTRRLRTLLYTAPLMELEAHKAKRRLSLQPQDLRALSLRALDTIIEAMGLGSGATREELHDSLSPLIRAADATLSERDVAFVVDAVLTGLLNQNERGTAFRLDYTDYVEDQATKRELVFHLVREEETPDGSVVLRATTEGINLYAGMLDFDVEDAQTAEEAVLRAQIERGRLAEAVQTARRARQRSIQYEEKLRGFLKLIRRQIDSVDWVGEVLGLLKEAAVHLQDRLDVERQLLTHVRERLDTDTAAEEREDLARVASLQDTLKDCVRRHLRLQRDVMSANAEYLDQQERQSFRPRTRGRLPDLEAEVFHPALELSEADLAELCPDLIRLFLGPVPPRLFYLPQVVDRLLAPRRNVRPEAVAPEAPELEELPLWQHRFTEEQVALVHALLADANEVRLSSLLAEARRRDWDPSTQHLLVLQVLQAWDPSSEDPWRVDSDGHTFATDTFEGDDLWIRSAT